jgi:glutamine amidotransferase-like uncharacterized protein
MAINNYIMLPTIAIFLHQPKCSVQSGNGIMKALSPYYRFKIFTKHELEDDFFDDVDIIAVPGGIGDSDTYSYLMKVNAQRIRNFIASGGKYLGICMGAYWADTDYLGLLNGVRAVQYIKQPNSDTKRPHAKNIAVNWLGNDINMYFYDGCALIGDETTFDTVARYRNGDPMAIIQDNVGLIGCHPEAEQHWYDSYSWMRKHYHNGTHYPLLLDFVNNLYRR